MKRDRLLRFQEGKVFQQLAGGFFNIDKPAGWTSHDVVAKIRGLLGIKKVGHLGTLDPQATGVLPICFGKGTKLASFLSDDDKQYEAVLRLGQETETEDATGNVTYTTPIPDYLKSSEGKQSIVQALDSFSGLYMQIPPMYSAIKVAGVPLYKVARRGEVVERASRPIMIRSITFLGQHGDDIAFRVTCSKGTYIRTLCSDIGKKLGVGGHLLSLRRTRSGIFHLDDSVELESFSAQCKQGRWEALVYPMETIVSDLPALWVKASQISRLCHGVQIGFTELEKWEPFKKGDLLRVLDSGGKLMAIGQARYDADKGPGRDTRLDAPFKIKSVLNNC